MSGAQAVQGVLLKHTIASKRGQQWVEQCTWCGTLICVTTSGSGTVAQGKLGPCPACGGTNWHLQYVPDAGIGMFKIDKETP